MPAVLAASAGSHPRIGETPARKKLRRAHGAWEEKKISDAEFAELEDGAAREVLDEQAAAGLDLLTDGLVRWYCPLSYPARKIAGLEINGLLRWFDTNFYVRQPVAAGALAWKEPLTGTDYTFARAHAGKKPVKPVLTGPVTLAKHTIVKFPRYQDFAALVGDYAAVLAREVGDLAGRGAEWIQLDEPSILKNPGEFALLGKALAAIAAARGKARLLLNTYFGDAGPHLKALGGLPVDRVGMDVTYSPGLLSRLAAEGFPKPLALGVIDGRNTKPDDVAVLAEALRPVLKKCGGDVHLQPSCGLEYLPADRAQHKLRNLAKLRDLLG